MLAGAIDGGGTKVMTGIVDDGAIVKQIRQDVRMVFTGRDLKDCLPFQRQRHFFKTRGMDGRSMRHQ